MKKDDPRRLDPNIITIDDLRPAGYCARGAVGWFKDHDMDFKDFVTNGIDRETFLTKGDHLAQRVVEIKDKRRG